MENNVEQGSLTGIVTPRASPMDSSLAPLPGARKIKHYADREEQRQERRLIARREAAELLESAIADCVDPKLAAVATLVVRKLNIEYCDILQFASDRWVVVFRARGAKGHTRLARAHQSRDPSSPVATTDTLVEIVQLADQMASLDVLRTEGTVDRIHLFISSRQHFTPLGILTVQSRTTLGLTSDERLFLDALGELIAAAIDSHALPSGDELTMKQLRTQAKGSRLGRVDGTWEN